MLSLHDSYLQRSLAGHAHLEVFDSDFGVFDNLKPKKSPLKHSASARRRKAPPKVPEHPWLKEGGTLAMPKMHGCR
jgi:hypothetical protein